MSFGGGVSGISENVAAHPTRGLSQRQQWSRVNAIFLTLAWSEESGQCSSLDLDGTPVGIFQRLTADAARQRV